MTGIIDSHHHFWRTAAQEQPWRTSDHGALERDFGPDDLELDLAAAGVDSTVLMQSVDEPAENERLAEYARSPRIAGVVGWLPISSGAAALGELDRVEIPKLCGVRCLIATDPLDWLDSPPVLELFRELASRGLAWDVVPITTEQVQAVLRLARTVPELSIVIDHLGRPPVDSAGWEPWASFVTELAGCPNVAMKVSVGIDVLTKWDAWDASALERYVAHVCAAFGPERLMLGSNWPVVLLRTSYAQAWSELSALAARQLPGEQERADLLGATAERWYGLGQARRR
jgi:L-fuconolactonase